MFNNLFKFFTVEKEKEKDKGMILTVEQIEYILIVMGKHKEKIRDMAWPDAEMGIKQTRLTDTAVEGLKQLRDNPPKVDTPDVGPIKKELFFDEINIGLNGKLIAKIKHPQVNQPEPMLGV